MQVLTVSAKVMFQARALNRSATSLPVIFNRTVFIRGQGKRAGHHPHWPEPDIDLNLIRIEHPESFPLAARAKPRRPARPPARHKPVFLRLPSRADLAMVW